MNSWVSSVLRERLLKSMLPVGSQHAFSTANSDTFRMARAHLPRPVGGTPMVVPKRCQAVLVGSWVEVLGLARAVASLAVSSSRATAGAVVRMECLGVDRSTAGIIADGVTRNALCLPAAMGRTPGARRMTQIWHTTGQAYTAQPFASPMVDGCSFASLTLIRWVGGHGKGDGGPNGWPEDHRHHQDFSSNNHSGRFPVLHHRKCGNCTVHVACKGWCLKATRR